LLKIGNGSSEVRQKLLREKEKCGPEDKPGEEQDYHHNAVEDIHLCPPLEFS
jgi:hypothetical protein